MASEPERVPELRFRQNTFGCWVSHPCWDAPLWTARVKPGTSRWWCFVRTFGSGVSEAIKRVIGRTVRVNGENYTVIGIMPASFRRLWLFPAQLWIPLVFTPAQLRAASAAIGRFLMCSRD